MRVAPVHIGLTVIVGIDGGVNVVPVFLLPNERLTEGILERSVGRVGHEYADAMTVQRCIEVVLAIAFDGLDSPRSIFTRTPRELLQRSHSTMLGPVDHIGR